MLPNIEQMNIIDAISILVLNKIIKKENWIYSASQWISFLQNWFKCWTIIARVLFHMDSSFH
jgi:hypothetical protein